MPAFDLFSIGHSNLPADRFVAMLQDATVNDVVDVRSVPASRHFPWFCKKNLAERLALDGVGYQAMGHALGGRPGDGTLYSHGVADYEAMAMQGDFRVALDRVQALAARSGVCLLCAEREPLDCHRCLLIARRLAERGLRIGHILHDGAIEPHAATERRLLSVTGLSPLDGDSCDLFASGQDERLAAAYRRRARGVAFRRNPPASHHVAEKR